jgi:hypothetical protein
LLVIPLSWGWAGFVWGYALIWFLVNDRIKLLAYKIFDPLKAKVHVVRKQDIADRAYEIYEQQGHHEGNADQDWKEAEKEIRKENSEEQKNV